MKAGKGRREKEEATAGQSCDGAGGRGRKGESRTVRGRRGRKKDLTWEPHAMTGSCIDDVIERTTGAGKLNTEEIISVITIKYFF